MKTTIHLSAGQRLNCALWAVKHKLKCQLGMLPNVVQTKYEHIRDRHNGPLSPEVLESFRQYQKDRVGADYKRRSKMAIDPNDPRPLHALPLQNRCALLVDSVLKAHPEIKTVANVGARVDVVSAHLAPKHPGVTFTSVDLQEELALHNSDLPQSQNWKFQSGYALDLLLRGELLADMVFTTSTSVLFNSTELNCYYDAMYKAGIKYIVVNEPWWSRGLGIVRPETLDLDEPFCAGMESDYHHNFVGKLERAGYEILQSDLTKGYARGLCALQIVARRKV